MSSVRPVCAEVLKACLHLWSERTDDSVRSALREVRRRQIGNGQHETGDAFAVFRRDVVGLELLHARQMPSLLRGPEPIAPRPGCRVRMTHPLRGACRHSADRLRRNAIPLARSSGCYSPPQCRPAPRRDRERASSRQDRPPRCRMQMLFACRSAGVVVDDRHEGIHPRLQRRLRELSSSRRSKQNRCPLCTAYG